MGFVGALAANTLQGIAPRREILFGRASPLIAPGRPDRANASVLPDTGIPDPVAPAVPA
jgi:hypothetical protein